MRYKTQPDYFSCGIIAIHNANLWKYKHTKYIPDNIKEICKLNETRGIERWDLDVSSVSFNSYTYDVNKLLIALEHGHGIIFQYSFNLNKDVGAHYIFVFKKDGLYLALNTIKDNYFEHIYYTLDELTRLLSNNPIDDLELHYPCGWIIER